MTDFIVNYNMAELNIKNNSEEVAREFASFLAEQINASDKINIALSGGSTPALLFDILAADYKELDWNKVHFYWGDERCVPPDDDESNFKMTKKHLLNHISMPVDNIHRVRGENDPGEEALRYAKHIHKKLPSKGSIPKFDVIILGMGTDGHTASIFPHEMNLLHEEEFCAVATHPESGQKRVTLTGNVINAAANICFLVTGASKNEKVREIFGQSGDYNSYPSSHIKAVSGKLYWFMDSAAAEGL